MRAVEMLVSDLASVYGQTKDWACQTHGPRYTTHYRKAVADSTDQRTPWRGQGEDTDAEYQQ